mmetsp:Transcript_89222/g.172816  ORF Transcript_89222/g.172816 Transcript_89222/m.172816 type:complete len:248 (+) Transcript_89222:57-800(+)
MAIFHLHCLCVLNCPLCATCVLSLAHGRLFVHRLVQVPKVTSLDIRVVRDKCHVPNEHPHCKSIPVVIVAGRSKGRHHTVHKFVAPEPKEAISSAINVRIFKGSVTIVLRRKGIRCSLSVFAELLLWWREHVEITKGPKRASACIYIPISSIQIVQNRQFPQVATSLIVNVFVVSRPISQAHCQLVGLCSPIQRSRVWKMCCYHRSQAFGEPYGVFHQPRREAILVYAPLHLHTQDVVLIVRDEFFF